ncbi:hypothetical protein [Vitiosangium sp. GDMCC 1.1324]|uniref:hypothetical protein n=1 Tax=Vitiosangium sp. (strain GDMCC 1.1324) TaxID=2138576 RepID=UPI000D3CB90A|nr:hypothetical protein [Vitiosangium sp. GDMCC 1.1324]PTL77675.1 hypothetical protein DAT35_43600 [Vitiosangium sp. GDMCC 1.1324]
MSDEQFFCEYCGHYSTSPTQCTNCGKDISDFDPNPPFIVSISGKLTLRPYDRSRAAEAWKALAELWDRLERETNLCIWPSQMDKFPPQGDVLELYGSTLEIGDIHKHLPGMFTCEFQELPESEIPKHPPTPRDLEIRERIKEIRERRARKQR